MNTGVLNSSDGNSIQTEVVYIGEFSRDNTLAAGTQAIVGVGFQPSHILFTSNVNGNGAASWGFADVASSLGLSHRHEELANEFEARGLECIHSRTGSSIALRGDLDSLDVDGFTINWLKQASPTGITLVKFIAFK